MGGPKLELGVARGSEFDEVFSAAVVHLHARDCLRVAAIERFGEPQERRQNRDDPALLLAQLAHPFMFLLRNGAAVIARNQCNDGDLLGLEAAQVAVLDQVIRVAMMLLVADVIADVVQQSRVFHPLAFSLAQRVNLLRRIEHRQRQRGHLA